MKPLFTKKNGTSQRVAPIEVKMPASYPASRITRESVSVTADGVKTYSQLLDALYALINRSKLTINTTIEVAVSNDQYILNISTVTSSAICFGSINSASAGSSSSLLYALKASGSIAQYCSHSNNGNNFTNQSESVLTSGAAITVYY